MNRIAWITSLSVVLFSSIAPVLALAQAPGFADISRPQNGEVLKGLVTIEGSAAHPAFLAYELSFAFDPNPMDTWFPILDPVQVPVTDGRLGLWDTTSISDGNYQIRLRVLLEDASPLEALVTNLRIRNSTPVEPTPSLPQSVVPSVTPTQPVRTPTPTPVPIPTTEGSIRVLRAFMIGAISGTIGLLILAAYTINRRWARARTTSRRVRDTQRREKNASRPRRRGRR
ncbi:MAG: hypothetical protein GTO14_04290 [Anaerolineales bacterium]|nr:hypothetical protein [Anaerolineales bacterium]